MIQLSALPVPGATPGADEAGVAAQLGGAQGADFGALLAIEASAVPAPETLAALPAEIAPVLPQVAIAATVLPEGGKTLPVSLPLAAPQMPEEAEAAEPAVQVDVHPVQSLMQALRARPGKVAPSDEGEAPPADTAALPAKAEIAEMVQPRVAVLPVLAPPAAPLEAKPVAPITEQVPTPTAAPTPAAAPTIAAVLPKPQREMPAPRTKAAPAVPLAPLAAITPLAPAAELAPVASLKVMPTTSAITLEPISSPAPAPLALRTAAPLTAPVLREEDAAPELSLAAPQAQAAPLAAPQTAPAPEPRHDFAALVDRIAAARDASGGGAVSVAVAHSDFGQVQLRFRHQEGTLSVAMASADPDFARAVSAMPPVIQPVSASAETTTQFSSQGGKGEGPAAQGGSSSFAQSRGSSTPDRREPQHQANNPAPARNPRGGHQRGQGIFA